MDTDAAPTQGADASDGWTAVATTSDLEKRGRRLLVQTGGRYVVSAVAMPPPTHPPAQADMPFCARAGAH